MKKSVALIYGGEGYEREISRLSAKNLFSLIDKELYDVFVIHIDESGRWFMRPSPAKASQDLFENNGSFTETFPVMLDGKSGFFTTSGLISIDCAIPCLHGDFGEDGRVQGALSTAHIRYIGQDVYASAMTSDKIYAKLAAESLNIPVAKWIFGGGAPVSDLKARAELEIGYPMFIKPARLGSSFGAHPVRCASDFDAAYSDASSFDERIIIEELVEFEYELECALLDIGERIILPGGRVFSNGGFYDYTAKYSREHSPRLEASCGGFSEVEKQASKYADALADLIGIQHISRIDFFITKDGGVIFNEINAFPGMTETSLYPRLVAGAGEKFGGFVNLLVGRVCSYDRRI